MSKIIIKNMADNHIRTISELEKICFSQPWSENSLSEELDNRTAHFLVAENETGTVMGYIGVFVVCESCYISNVAVFPDFRRSGVGKALLDAASETAKEFGAESVSLEVRPSNTAAIQLYISSGFEEVGLRKNFYRSPVEDALILTKELFANNF